MGFVDLLELYNAGATERYVIIRSYTACVLDPHVDGIRTHLKEEA